jgi:hypothetical protein
VQSPDQLSITVRAHDADGLDSLWVTLDQREDGLDALLRESFEAEVVMPVQSGHPVGTHLAVRLRGRDLAGFSDTIVDTVLVMP